MIELTCKHEKKNRCPRCGSAAHMAENTDESRGKTRFAVVCDSDICPNRRVPRFADCFATEIEAVADWNAR